MNRWVVLFDDTPAMLRVRKERAPRHVEYLEKNATRILIGGGLRPAPDTPFVGGLWIVEADTYDEVLELVAGDPYFCPEHRKFRILAWDRAIDRTVSI